MPTLTEFFNLCDYCVYAPCVCGNEPQNCANYVQRNGIELSKERADNAADNNNY